MCDVWVRGSDFSVLQINDDCEPHDAGSSGAELVTIYVARCIRNRCNRLHIFYA